MKIPASRRRLLLTLFTGFIVVLMLLAGGQVFFLQMMERLEAQTVEERARMSLGENIVQDLHHATLFFYQIPISIEPERQRDLHGEILATLEQLRLMLGVVESGGEITRVIPLNLPERNDAKQHIVYRPTRDSERYILEIIELRPKLQEMRERSDWLLDHSLARDRAQMSGDVEAWRREVGDLKSYLKESAPFFVRLDENANQFYVKGLEQLTRIEELVRERKKSYAWADAAMLLSLMAFAFGLTALVVRQLVDDQTHLRGQMEALDESRREIAEAHERLIAILDGVEATVYVMDRKDKTLLFLNRQGRDRFSAYTGQPCWRLYSREDHPCACCVHWPFGEKFKGVRTWECQREGRWFEAHGQPIVWEGNREAILVLVFDVSERRRLEEDREGMAVRLQRMEKMESLGMMVGGVAHDLNNLLSGIVSYPELLMLHLPENSPVRQGLTVIKLAGQRMGAVVDDLLTVARGVAMATSPISLNQVVRDYLNSPEYRKLVALYPGVVVESVLAGSLPVVAGSAVHLGKVLMNLTQNAVEAVEGYGRVEIGTAVEGDRILLWVADNGSGIAAEDLEHIFEPFYSKKKMGRSGTGLGLAIVWNVVRQHGGEVTLQSDPGASRFNLVFPLLEQDEADLAEEGPAGDLPLGAGQHILVVDDEPMLRELAQEMLCQLGYLAGTAASGEEALERLRQEPWDLLLLDMIMAPGMSGRETFEVARQEHPGLGAIVCSGYAASEDVDRTMAMGARVLLKKPFTMAQLANALREALTRG
jgi:signal transduction histidine kinase